MAVAQAARRALHRDHRVEREVEARRGPGHEPRLGAGGRVGRAPGRADDRVDVRAGDQRPPVQEELRQADLGLLLHLPPESSRLPDRGGPPGPPDRERRAALPGQEAVITTDPAGQRTEGDVVFVLLHGHGAVGRTDLAQQLPGERPEEPLRVAPLLVGRRGERRPRPAHRSRRRRGCRAPSSPRRPRAGCRRRAPDRARAAARRRRCRAAASRAATTGSRRTPRWPCRRAWSGSGSSSPRSAGRPRAARRRRLVVRVEDERGWPTSGRPRPAGRATSSWERWYAGVSTQGVTALQPNECRSASRLLASLAASSGSSDASDHQPATTYVAASPATPLGASWATSSSGSWSANRCSTES